MHNLFSQLEYQHFEQIGMGGLIIFATVYYIVSRIKNRKISPTRELYLKILALLKMDGWQLMSDNVVKINQNVIATDLLFIFSNHLKETISEF